MKVTVPAVRDLLDLKGRVAVVTGGGRGIGAGIALRFAEAGARVALSYHAEPAPAQALAKTIEKEGGAALVVPADVTQAEDINALRETAVKKFGRIYVWISNAGIYPLGPILELDQAAWQSVIDANLSSVHLGTQAAASQMVEQGNSGAIINIASIEAHYPGPAHAHYSASKSGVVMYTRSAASELGEHSIRVNSVSPGLIWREGIETSWPEGVSRYTKAAALGRLGQPADVADACLFLASPAARWISGTDLIVDGGVMTGPVY